MEDCLCSEMQSLSLIAAGFWTLWCLIDYLCGGMVVGGPPGLGNPSEDVQAARLVRYEHVNSEVTRYRDLVWKIAGYAWAIYFAIYTLRKDGACKLSSNVLLLLAAFSASVYYTYCEVLIEQNRKRRMVLEEAMKLDETFRHRETGGHLLALVVSFIMFGAVIWFPVFVLWR